METIKIKQNISVQQEVEKEIQVPSYWTYPPCFHWKIINKEVAVKVIKTHLGHGIETDAAIQPFFHKDLKECSKEDFDAAYSEAMDGITKLNNPITEPATE